MFLIYNMYIDTHGNPAFLLKIKIRRSTFPKC